MTPAFCRISHKPDEGQYADCVRACVASVLDLDTEQVPHFYADNDPEAGRDMIAEFLLSRRYVPFYTHYDGAIPLVELLAINGEQNPDVHFILFGSTESGDHVVVCQGGKVVHDPAWVRSPLQRGASNGFWTLLVIVRA